MRIFLITFAFLFFLSADAQQNIVQGEFIIQLNQGVQKEVFDQQVKSNATYNFELKRQLSKRFNIWLCVSEIGEESNKLKVLQSLPGLKVAQHNHFVQLRETQPNDASFDQQWALKNTGQSGGVAGADVDATLAWDVTTGGTTALGDTIVVAVIDGGFQMNHPDLIENYFVNRLEIAGNGIDDDNNGYIDDVSGWDAYSDDGTIPSDQHGTHVSGIIGAVGDNNIGVSGINWHVKILPIAGSSGNESTVVAAYAYAADMRILYNETNGEKGAFVVATNSSFGVDQGDPSEYPIWCSFYDELGAAGILSCGATANANFNIDQTGDIPTACASEFLIAVTNSTRNDVKSNGAAFGIESIDIASPGTAVYSTVTNSNYGNLSGTSMATPLVAGSIALMYSAACDVLISDYKLNPSGIAIQMKQYLLQGAEQIEAFDGLVAESRRLNANGAIQQVLTYICDSEVPPVANFNASGRTGCPGLTVGFNNFSSSNADSYLWEFPGGSPSSSEEMNPSVIYNDFGSYDVQLIVSNEFGSDTTLFSSYVQVTNTGIKTVYSESFEEGTISELGFTVENPDNQNTWEVSPSSGISGSNFSLGINMFNNTSNEGQWDYVVSPAISLQETSDNVLQVKYAHRRKATTQEDSLIVNISADQGQNWVRLEAKGGGSNSSNQLATNVLLNSSFTPVSTADWCIADECLSIDISNWDGSPEVWIRFDAYNDAGNNIFIDDVLVSGLCTAPVVSSVNASFVSASQEVCEGGSIQFNNLSDNATLYQWTFEGGTPASSNSINPNVIYNAVGEYDVTLIASNSTFSDTITFEAYVNVNNAPATPVITADGAILTVNSPGTYQWYIGSSFISGANQSTYTATQDGDYSVIVTFGGCAVESDPITVLISSIGNLSNNDISIFPNPANDFITISYSGAESINYNLFDAVGRLVRNGNINTSNNVIKLDDLPSGLYPLSLQNASTIRTYKIIHP
ncbi:MAG: S8 family serine peptidase [Bacteroidia bacterium]